MVYEFWIKKLGKDREAECVFCGKEVNWGDYYCMCRVNSSYFKIPRVLRYLLPKCIIKHIMKSCCI